MKSIISCDSYYTAIASDELAKRACEKQNKLMTELAGVKELPQECRAEVKYNQVLIKYDLSASVCATDNIISTFCEENDIRYVSFSDVNEKYRTELINAYLRYGITILAVLVINILIVAVVANNRLDSRRQRIELLMRLGASKIDVCRIFMTEAIRESLWCVFSLPMVLVMQYLIYRKNV